MTQDSSQSSQHSQDTGGGESLSRRGFLRAAGYCVIAAGGVAYLATHGPASAGMAAAGTDSNAEAADSQNATLGDGKTLRVGMEAAYAPYNWQVSAPSDTTIPIQNVDGAYADGYDVQFAKIVAKALGMDAVAVKMSFSGLIDALNNGQIDIIIAGMSATPERSEAIDFSDPYFVGTFGLLVRKDSKYVNATSLEDFRGAAVLGQKDTLLDTCIDEIPDVNHLTPVDSVPSQLSQVNRGTCDAVTFNVENADGFVQANPDLVAIIFDEDKGFKEKVTANAGIKKGQKAVLAKINEAINAVPDDKRQQMIKDCVARQPQ